MVGASYCSHNQYKGMFKEVSLSSIKKKDYYTLHVHGLSLTVAKRRVRLQFDIIQRDGRKYTSLI